MHEFPTLQETEINLGDPRPLSLLHDVEMGVTAELGRRRMTVRDLLSLTPGAVIELDRAAGSPVDVLVNGTLIARGEVVVIDEEFGIRISEIVAPDPPGCIDPWTARRSPACLIRLVLSLGGRHRLMVGVAAVLKRRGFGGSRADRCAEVAGRDAQVEVLARKPLGRNASIAVVRAGQQVDGRSASPTRR